MRILYHHRIMSKDGQYVHVEEMVHALQGLGHEVKIVGPAAVEKGDFGADAGVVVLLKRLMPKAIYELLELGYSLRDYPRLCRAAREFRPDALYERYNLFFLSGVWLRRRLKLPMLLEINAPLYEERKRFDGIALDRLARWTERLAWRSADVALPVTEVLAGHVRAAGVPAVRVQVIPNGIQPERFAALPSRDEAKRALGLAGKTVLGFTGFMREWHGLDRVLERVAASANRSLHVVFVGDGPARAGLEARVRSSDLAGRVIFTGIVGREDIGRYVAAFDIALQPAVVPYASPLKLFEYMACGCAIVAPATPNIREVLTHDENAWLFPPNDEAGFANAVETLAADEPLRHCLGNAARATIARKRLTWRGNAERVTRFFETLRGRPGRAPNSVADERS
jgi:glycosyltransferase involved in cell wall biosynthesis